MYRRDPPIRRLLYPDGCSMLMTLGTTGPLPKQSCACGDNEPITVWLWAACPPLRFGTLAASESSSGSSLFKVVFKAEGKICEAAEEEVVDLGIEL